MYKNIIDFDANLKMKKLSLSNAIIVYPRYTAALLSAFPHLRISGKKLADGYLTNMLINSVSEDNFDLPDFCYLELNDRGAGWIEVRVDEPVIIYNNSNKDEVVYKPDLLRLMNKEYCLNLCFSFINIFSAAKCS